MSDEETKPAQIEETRRLSTTEGGDAAEQDEEKPGDETADEEKPAEE